MRTKTVFRVYFAWQDEEEERWLEKMARDGWHLKGGRIFYRFAAGPPKKVRYRLDFRRSGTTNADYVQLFRDAGWEHVSAFGHWHCFRTEDQGAPEVFTDPESLIARHRRVIRLLVMLMGVNIVIMATAVAHPRAGVSDLARLLQLSVVCLLGWGVWRIKSRINRLTRKLL
jgi:hypothetical protein